jgi:hypothetical protein
VRDTACRRATLPDKTGHSERERGSFDPRGASPRGVLHIINNYTGDRMAFEMG